MEVEIINHDQDTYAQDVCLDADRSVSALSAAARQEAYPRLYF